MRTLPEETVCKGSIRLGTGCGYCARCKEEIKGILAENTRLRASAVGTNVGAEMVVVPRVPTDEMVRAGSKARADTGSLNGEVNTKATYRAMIQAVPTVGANVGAENEQLRSILQEVTYWLKAQNISPTALRVHTAIKDAEAVLAVRADVRAEERPWDVTGIPSVTYGRNKE